MGEGSAFFTFVLFNLLKAELLPLLEDNELAEDIVNDSGYNQSTELDDIILSYVNTPAALCHAIDHTDKSDTNDMVKVQHIAENEEGKCLNTPGEKSGTREADKFFPKDVRLHGL